MDYIKPTMKFLTQCPTIQGFFAIDGKIEDESIIATPNGMTIVKTDVMGISEYWIEYSIHSFWSTSDIGIFSENDTEEAANENIMDYNTVQSILDWLILQNKERNFPIYKGQIVERIMPTGIAPIPNGIDEMRLAKYLITFRVYLTGEIF